ncbi:MAG: AraC family transcriptional regulator [Acinetobacter populi]|jgi:AraC-like DNA-binding protein|uniref:AraC family transcriptional regulator n=1 Tax=Acinetobacter populi TaxID=1582270 RepID=UPI0023577C6A|nr:AraC family transcriptional regulator [Acinetobacter populi]MCH4247952.1 AraC family transcriptional regulator [Acinetobacter populi]
MLNNSLLNDVQNLPVLQPYKHCSQDWDEIKWWSDQMYMPYTVQPMGRGLKPQSSMHSLQVGSMIVTRFKYGIPVHIYDWDQTAGNILLLTTLEGQGSHAVNSSHWQTTKIGESFLADCSRNDDYAIKFDPDHLQLNLTIPHQSIAELILQNFGHEAPDRLWHCKTFFGGEGSSWLVLLRYLMQSIAEIPSAQLTQRAGEHLQQMVSLHILNEWALRAKIDLTQKETITPKYIERAEQYMREYLHYSPTIAEVAQAVGVSIRTLSAGFKKYRQRTASETIREMRLQQVRQQLLNAEKTQNVADIAHGCGYINLGDFARQYRLRYGELPSQTLKK